MRINRHVSHQITRDSYLRLLNPYAECLSDFSDSISPYGTRFELLFNQIVGLLNEPALFNLEIPTTFLETARLYKGLAPDTLRHFQYDENRQFFLNDLLEWLHLSEQ